MKKTAHIHPVLQVEGEDKPANRFGEESVALVKEIIQAGIDEMTRRRVMQRQQFRRITLTKIEEVEGGDDDSGD